MPFWFVFAKSKSRRSFDSFSHQASTRRPLSPKSHGINIFADPHPLTSVASIFYKNIEGEGASPSAVTANPQSLTSLFATHPKNPPITPLPATDPISPNFKSFACHTCETPRGPAGKLLTKNLRGTATPGCALPPFKDEARAHTHSSSTLLSLKAKG